MASSDSAGLGLGLSETVMPNRRAVFKNRSYDRDK